ncbi:hypothetical protein OG542_30135 [Streptomyces violaceus]|uniref:hypothetical protein n=1 Tax=Streptomyces violaceus TaxID=1936 RepID=UPI002E1AAC17
MAKNKNRERKQRPTERGQRADRSPAAQTEPQLEVEVAAPGDMATRKRKRSFGHN